MSRRTVKSEELLSFVTSGSRGWAKYYSDSGPVFLRIGNLDHSSISLDLAEIQRVRPPSGGEGTRTRVQGGDLLISITADVGMVGLVPDGFEEAYINQHIALARPKDVVHPPYLAWYLSSPGAQRQFRELQRGATKVGLGLDDIRAIDVPLPLLKEQRQIVAEIEKQFTRLDAGIAALRRMQANLKRYRAAVLKAACEGRLVPTEVDLAIGKRKSKFESGEALLARILSARRQCWQGRGQYKEPAAPEDTKLPALPAGWAYATVEQLATRVVDGTHHTPEYISNGVAFISVKDIRAGIIHFDSCKYISAEAHAELSKRCDAERGDVLITKSGTIGRMAVVNTDRPFSLFVSVALIKPVRGIFDSKFLKLSLEGYIGSINISQDVKGALLKNLHLEDLRVIALRLPPLAEQARIVAEVERRLSVVEELETVVNANLCRATRLRQSILQKAFYGQYR